MKTILKLAFLLALLTIAQSKAQTWKELMDSSGYYKVKGNLENALKWGRKAFAQAEKDYQPLDTNYSIPLSNLYQIFFYLQKLDSAIFYCEKALYLNRQIYNGDNTELANNISWLGYIYNYTGKYDKVETLSKEALEMKRHLYKNDNQDLTISINNLAKFYEFMGRYAEAEALFKEALEMKRRMYKRDNPEMVVSLVNMANFYNNINRREEAENLLKEALETSRRIFKSDNPVLANTIGNFAAFYANIGRYKEAEPFFIESFNMFNNLYKSDHKDLAVIINNMGEFYKRTGRYAEAEPLLKRSLAMRRRLFKGDHEDLAIINNNMATFLYDTGRFEEAELYMKEALNMMRRIHKGDNLNLAESINNMAMLYKYKGIIQEAEQLFKEALEMYRRLLNGDSRITATIINNLAVLYNESGKFEEAEELLKEALEMQRRLFKTDSPGLACRINNMALFYKSRGRYKEAEQLYNELSEICSRIYEADNMDLVIMTINRAFFYEIIERSTEGDSLFNEALNTLKNQLINYFPSLSEKEKDQFWNTIQNNFEGFNSFALNRPNLNQVNISNTYDNQLITKGILLNSTVKVKNRILNSNKETLIKKFEEWQFVKNKISKLHSQSVLELNKKGINLDSIINDANDREKELSRISEDFKKEYEKKEIKWQEVQKSIKNNEAGIELVRFRYFDRKFTDTIYYAALIVKDTSSVPELVLLNNGNDLEGKYIEEYRNQAGQFKKRVYDPDKVNDKLKELYSQFWAPIQEKLKGIKTVYLSPDGVYNLLNLNTLINPETGKYLLEEIDLRLVTSTRDLVEIDTPLNPLSRGENIAELFGDPQFDLDSTKYELLASNIRSNTTREYYSLGNTLDSATRGAISPLPGTRKEIENIACSLQKQGWKVNRHLGPEALEEALKAVDNPRVLHIATHGKFLKDVERRDDERMMGFETQRFVENPLLRSMLLFSGAENTLLNQGLQSATQREDGLLTAYEAQNLNLDNTELVVLSACETGLGEVKNGEGVYGLQRAFQVAGAKSLIMSLWSVSDEATQELMTSFYSKWLGGKSKREAFREAQIELKKKYPGFYYWGAFVMVGE